MGACVEGAGVAEVGVERSSVLRDGAVGETFVEAEVVGKGVEVAFFVKSR